MPLSNADRQRRFRERRKQQGYKVAYQPPPLAVAAVTSSVPSQPSPPSLVAAWDAATPEQRQELLQALQATGYLPKEPEPELELPVSLPAALADFYSRPENLEQYVKSRERPQPDRFNTLDAVVAMHVMRIADVLGYPPSYARIKPPPEGALYPDVVEVLGGADYLHAAYDLAADNWPPEAPIF